jgi:hypothetical protein
MSSGNWNDSADASTSPINGLTPGLNWTILKPEGNGLGVTNTAVGIGLQWFDVDSDGLLDREDRFWLRYAVFANDVTEIDTVEKLNTAVGGGGNTGPMFFNDPFDAPNALVDAAYTNSIAGEAFDLDGDPLTYSKTAGPAWLNVATNGVLSGTPTSGNLGVNVFTVQVSDGTTDDTATLNLTASEGRQLVDFSHDPDTGDGEVSIVGLPGDVSQLQSSTVLPFGTEPVLLSGATVGTLWTADEVIADEIGNATVQFNRGTTNGQEFLRSEATGGAVTYVLAEYLFLSGDDSGTAIELSDGSTPTGSFVITNRDSNPQYSFWNSSNLSTNSRYSRWIPDFRAKGEVETQGSGYYLHVSGTASNLWQGPWVNILTNGGDQIAMAFSSWNDPPAATNNAAPLNGLTPDDGVGQEEINWALLRPETGQFSFGNANAMALGILWTDNDADGLVDGLDTFTLKYVVGAIGIDQAHAFSGMDTKEELNAAVGNDP